MMTAVVKKWVRRGGEAAAGTGSGTSGQPVGTRWPGHAAAACALVFAVVTLSWALGGRWGMSLLGREVIRLADERPTGFMIAAWVSGLLKLAGAVLALALVQPWGLRVFPRGMLLVAGWTSSAVLILYGGSTMVSMMLVLAGRISVPPDMDWRGFYGHLCVWDPWFLAWGLLLALATRRLPARF
jgi:hypothetical protein